MQRRTMVRLVMTSLVVRAGTAATPARAAELAVMIDNFTFGPAELSVSVGDKVTWTNRDDIPHSVTHAATPRTFKSSVLDTGDTFSFVFTAPGTYHYFCSLHPHMQATVVVK